MKITDNFEINKLKLEESINYYLQNFIKRTKKIEKRQIFLTNFKKNWDLEQIDFGTMLTNSLENTSIVLNKNIDFNKGIFLLSKNNKKNVKSCFYNLFNETLNYNYRIDVFEKNINQLFEEDNQSIEYKKTTNVAARFYLWLRYPKKYIYFQHRNAIYSLKLLVDNWKMADFKDISNQYSFYEKLKKEFFDNNFINLKRDLFTESLLFQDYLFFLINNYYVKKINEYNIPIIDFDFQKKSYYWLNASTKFWSFSRLELNLPYKISKFNYVGGKKNVFSNFENIKTGDYILGYNTEPIGTLSSILKVLNSDNQYIYFIKVIELQFPLKYSTVKFSEELKDFEFNHVMEGSLFKISEKEFRFLYFCIKEKNNDVTKLMSWV